VERNLELMRVLKEELFREEDRSNLIFVISSSGKLKKK
jgi:hypothetical protein